MTSTPTPSQQPLAAEGTQGVEKFSDGPYKAVQRRDGQGFWISSDNEIVGVVDGYCSHPQIRANAELLAASWSMLAALREWKCPGCGGKGTYQQNAAGRARDEARGRDPDPAFNPDPVTCKVCEGHGLHPTARAAITLASGGKG